MFEARRGRSADSQATGAGEIGRRFGGGYRSDGIGGLRGGGPAWDVAAQLPGSGQLGLAKRLLTRYSWWKLEPQPDLIDPHWSKSNYWKPFAANIPGEAVIAFTPAYSTASFRNLKAGSYRAFFFNPTDGVETEIGSITPDTDGSWKIAEVPIFQDWVVVLENKA